jgi:hypothetical protein
MLGRIDLARLVDIGALAEQSVVCVFDIVMQGVFVAVEPHHSDHGTHCRNRPCCQRGVADDRLGVGMPIGRVRVSDALVQQVSEAALAKAVRVPRWKVTAQLVDRQLKYEPDFRGNG